MKEDSQPPVRSALASLFHFLFVVFQADKLDAFLDDHDRWLMLVEQLRQGIANMTNEAMDQKMSGMIGG